MGLLLKGPEATELFKAAWLEKRRQYVTSTDVPILFGQGYVESSPTKLWREKRTGDDFFVPTERTEIGKLMEPVIIARYEAQTGRKVVKADPYTLHVSEKYPWLAASLDAFDSEGVGLELKNHGDFISGVEDIPTGWMLQTQTQMLVMDRKVWRLAIMCRGSEVKIFDLEAHPVQAKIIEKSKRFFELVQKGEVPEPEFPGDNDGLGFAFYEPTDTVLEADSEKADELLERCLERASYLDQKRELVDALDLTEASIKYALGNATVAVLPDESKVTWKPDKNGRRSLRYYRKKE